MTSSGLATAMRTTVVVALAWQGHLSAAEPPGPGRPAGAPDRSPALPAVVMRGRVVCLPEEMRRRYDIELPTRHIHQWALQTTNGACFLVLPGRHAQAILEDERVRSRELELRVRLLPGAQAIEVLNVRSVRHGVVHDLYYYCDVCAIQSVSPDVCSCCQAPVELVEKPLGTRSE